MNTKRIVPVVTLVSCLAVNTLAGAASAPTSQFGFKGWPYRQSTSCPSVQVTACPENTCKPTTVPTETPLPTVAVTATPAPTATTEPVTTPTATASPTSQPTATATTKPTPAPTPTKTPENTTTPTIKPTAPSTGGDYTTVPVSAQEENAFALLNADRAKNGQSALQLDPELCRLARMKSEDMNANQYFAHTSPTLGSAAEMLRNHGYSFTSVGENIAHHATVEKSQAAFMSSTGHRANILGSQWKKVGIGVCYDRNGYVYVTQLFVR